MQGIEADVLNGDPKAQGLSCASEEVRSGGLPITRAWRALYKGHHAGASGPEAFRPIDGLQHGAKDPTETIHADVVQHGLPALQVVKHHFSIRI